jgi:hypothetical protein
MRSSTTGGVRVTRLARAAADVEALAEALTQASAVNLKFLSL